MRYRGVLKLRTINDYSRYSEDRFQRIGAKDDREGQCLLSDSLRALSAGVGGQLGQNKEIAVPN